jgi:hypothetical protein
MKKFSHECGAVEGGSDHIHSPTFSIRNDVSMTFMNGVEGPPQSSQQQQQQPVEAQ